MKKDTKRRLEIESCGVCHNPNCRKDILLQTNDGQIFDIMERAHIEGQGKDPVKTPRHNLNSTEKDALQNLLILCPNCHTLIDKKPSATDYPLSLLQNWKQKRKNERLQIMLEGVRSRKALLENVLLLLEKNRALFKSIGPFSLHAHTTLANDVRKNWGRVCIREIIPNNAKIISIFEENKRILYSPKLEIWQSYCLFESHANSFKENVVNNKIDAYQIFPVEFSYAIEKELGISTNQVESLDIRKNSVSQLISKYLETHKLIKSIAEQDIYQFTIEVEHSKETLNCFVTCNYFFTIETVHKILEINPYVNVIILFNGNIRDYTPEAKIFCIENKIGLFSINDFMGALNQFNKDKNRYLNYLTNIRIEERKNYLKGKLRNLNFKGIKIYVFGSFIRNEIYNDIDLFIEGEVSQNMFLEIDGEIRSLFENQKIHIESGKDHAALPWRNNNCTLMPIKSKSLDK